MYLVKDAHAGIISHEIYDLVQQEITRRSNKHKISEHTKTENAKFCGKYALTELLYCNACGSPYRRCTWRNRDGSKRIVWRCVKRIEHGKRYCADSPTLDESKIKTALLHAMNRTLSEKDTLVSMLIRHHREIESDNDLKNIPSFERRIKEIGEAIMAMVQTGAKSGKMESYERQIKQLSEERRKLEKELADSKVKEKENSQTAQTTDAFQTYLEDAPEGLRVYDEKAARWLFLAGSSMKLL